MRAKRVNLPSIGTLVLCAMGIGGSLILTTRALALQPEPIEVDQSNEPYEVVVEEQRCEPYTVDNRAAHKRNK